MKWERLRGRRVFAEWGGVYGMARARTSALFQLHSSSLQEAAQLTGVTS